MKIIIDEKVCLKHSVTPYEVMLALAIRSGEFEEDISNLAAREIIVKRGKNNQYCVTQHWSDVLDEILCDSNKVTDRSDEQLLELAKQMRECYPEGKMPGTAFYYRCNNKEVMLKLKKFFVKYGNYSDEEIIAATKAFVASYRGDYHYLPLIKYFISKMKAVPDEEGNIHNVEYSSLADYLENRGNEEVGADTSDDWLVSSRN